VGGGGCELQTFHYTFSLHDSDNKLGQEKPGWLMHKPKPIRTEP
jgi:hypothetical protein